MNARLLGVVLGLLGSCAAWAEVYQWRDAEGRLQFSDTPPPQSQPLATQSRPINAMPGLPPPAASPVPEAEQSAAAPLAVKAKPLNAGQLQQQAHMQCASLVTRMPALLDGLEQHARLAIAEGRVSKEYSKKALAQLQARQRQIKRDPRICVSDYVQDSTARWTTDCILEAQDTQAFARCVQFPG